MLLGNGKFMFVFWLAIADDFDVTKWNFEEFPADFTVLDPSQIDALRRMMPALEQAMLENTQFKLNAGKKVGNYNLAKCSTYTDSSDMVFARAFGFVDAWDDVELYCSQAVRTDFSAESEDD